MRWAASSGPGTRTSCGADNSSSSWPVASGLCCSGGPTTAGTALSLDLDRDQAVGCSQSGGSFLGLRSCCQSGSCCELLVLRALRNCGAYVFRVWNCSWQQGGANSGLSSAITGGEHVSSATNSACAFLKQDLFSDSQRSLRLPFHFRSNVL